MAGGSVLTVKVSLINLVLNIYGKIRIADGVSIKVGATGEIPVKAYTSASYQLETLNINTSCKGFAASAILGFSAEY